MNLEKFFYWICVFTGLSVMLLSGGCVVTSTISGVTLEIFLVVFLVMGISFIIGLVIMIYGGSALYNSYKYSHILYGNDRDCIKPHSDYDNLRYLGRFYLEYKFAGFIINVFFLVIYLIWYLFKDDYAQYVKFVVPFEYLYQELFQILLLLSPLVFGVMIYFFIKGIRNIYQKIKSGEKVRANWFLLSVMVFITALFLFFCYEEVHGEGSRSLLFLVISVSGISIIYNIFKTISLGATQKRERVYYEDNISDWECDGMTSGSELKPGRYSVNAHSAKVENEESEGRE